MNYKLAITAIVLICAALAFAGCTTPSAGSASPAAGTGSVPASTGSGSMVTQPTDIIPDYNTVTVDVGEKDYLGKIPVIFQGGQGQISVKKIDVKLTRTDGSTQTATVGTKKGDEVDLDGTRGSGSLQGQPDRVEVWVTMNNGQTYKVADVLREYRTRGS
jgi:hypothetical protein